MNIEFLLVIIGGIVTAILGVFYITSRIRHQDMQLLRQTNDDLRKSIDDKGKEIRDMGLQMQELKDRVSTLETSNKTLEDLVKIALEEYFRNHPDIAGKIKERRA